MAVTGSTSLPIGGRDAEFNGSKARRRIIDHFTSNGKTNWKKVEAGFFWTDRNKPDVVTSYNLGFADIVGGKLVALPHGLFAVAGGHGVTRIQGVPTGDKTAIKRKVNGYYRKMRGKWPNDKFPFNPPFPEVKELAAIGKDLEEANILLEEAEMVIDGLDTEDPVEMVERIDYAKMFEETTEKFFHDGGKRPTSFADLAGVEAVRQAIQKVFKTVYDFEMLAYGVATQSETPGALVSGLKSLTDEMRKIFGKMTFEVDDDKAADTESDKALTGFINGDPDDWEIKQGKSSALLKNANGDQFFYGRFTNNIWDKEGEVLLTKAHQEFVDYLDANPEQAPELWDWHERETAKTHKAVWWDFSDGFLHAIWPVTKEEAEGIEAFMEEFEPGMSHGFKVLDREGRLNKEIAQYRTYEASILPLEFAANEWTTFEIILAKEKEENDKKMFSPEKQRALSLLSLGRYQAPLGKASESDAQDLDDDGVQRKYNKSEKPEVKTMAAPEVPEVPTTPPVTPPVTPTPVPPLPVPEPAKVPMVKAEASSPSDIQALQASIVEGFSMLTEKMTQIAAQVASNTDDLKGIKEKKGESPSVAAWVAAQKAGTSIGVDEPVDPALPEGEKRRRDPDPLFGTGPEETPFELDGHLLANY